MLLNSFGAFLEAADLLLCLKNRVCDFLLNIIKLIGNLSYRLETIAEYIHLLLQKHIILDNFFKRILDTVKFL